jgi:hypothetical protein
MCVYWRLGLPGEGGGRSRGSPSREQLRPRAHRCRPQLRGATFPFPETFRIAVISDPDKKSKAKDKAEWRAQYMTGTLRRNGETYAVSWDEPASVGTGMNEAGRGAELSELVRYNGGLYTFDDRTGIMFEILNPEDRSAAVTGLTVGDRTGDSCSCATEPLHWRRRVDVDAARRAATAHRCGLADHSLIRRVLIVGPSPRAQRCGQEGRAGAGARAAAHLCGG